MVCATGPHFGTRTTKSNLVGQILLHVSNGEAIDSIKCYQIKCLFRVKDRQFSMIILTIVRYGVTSFIPTAWDQK